MTATPREGFFDNGLEPERYELGAPPRWSFAVARREFLAMVGGGLAFACLAPTATSAQDPARRRGGQQGDSEITAWLHIGDDGTITVYTGKVDVGQDTRTSLAQAVAEELDTTLDAITMVMGDTQRVPYDRGTFGSQSTPQMAPQLRRAAAAARRELVRLAAERWHVDAHTLRVENGTVLGNGSARLSFGELAHGQQLAHAIGDVTLQAPDRWQVLGTPAPKTNAHAIVTGSHVFPSDVTRPGLRHGAVLRPPGPAARLAKLDVEPARAIEGAVIVHDGDFAGAVAATAHDAARAVAAMQASWDEPKEQPSSDTLFAWLQEHPAASAGWRGSRPHARGDVATALQSAEHRIDSRYEIAYIAHVPLEPRAAVAEWSDGSLTVWTGTQRPFGVREELARAFHLDPDEVRVLVPDTGAGYGGKHTGECAIEAARLAKAAGAPVKLRWTREEEMTFAYFRPAGVIEVRAGVAGGKLVAWQLENWNSGGSGIETPYEVADQHVEFHATDAPLRQGSYRGLAATANHFARESAMDDAARACQADPLAFRLAHLQDDRLRAVLQAAADRFGWADAPADGCGHGLACGHEKGSYVATCAEIARDGDDVVVKRLVTAFDCGAVVNPDNLRNQIEGAAIQALGGARFEAIRFEDGRILSDRLSRYRVPRFGDVPAIEAVLVDRRDLPSAGAGETPIVCVAPAIGNAIVAAGGTRRTSLPMGV